MTARIDTGTALSLLKAGYKYALFEASGAHAGNASSYASANTWAVAARGRCFRSLREFVIFNLRS